MKVVEQQDSSREDLELVTGRTQQQIKEKRRAECIMGNFEPGLVTNLRLHWSQLPKTVKSRSSCGTIHVSQAKERVK